MLRFLTTWAVSLALAFAPCLASAQMLLLGAGKARASAVTYTTLDSATKTASVTLSNGDLTAATGATQGSVHSVATETASKINHFAVTLTSATALNIVIGVLDATYPMGTGDFLGESAGAHSCGVATDGTMVGTDGGSVASGLGALSVSDVVDVEWDATTRSIRFAKNGGSWTVDWPCTAPGTVYAGTNIETTTATFNFGATAFTKSVTAGGVSWGQP